MFTEATITYLAALYAELKEYQAKRARIQAKIDAGDDSEYYAIVLRDWDHVIGVTRGKIAREEAQCSSV